MNHTEPGWMLEPYMRRYTAFVDEINGSQAVLMLPVTIFMVTLMIVGLCGNLIVVTVLVRKKNKSIANYFMLSLAAIDLIRYLYTLYIISLAFAGISHRMSGEMEHEMTLFHIMEPIEMFCIRHPFL